MMRLALNKISITIWDPTLYTDHFTRLCAAIVRICLIIIHGPSMALLDYRRISELRWRGTDGPDKYNEGFSSRQQHATQHSIIYRRRDPDSRDIMGPITFGFSWLSCSQTIEPIVQSGRPEKIPDWIIAIESVGAAIHRPGREKKTAELIVTSSKLFIRQSIIWRDRHLCSFSTPIHL